MFLHNGLVRVLKVCRYAPCRQVAPRDSSLVWLILFGYLSNMLHKQHPESIRSPNTGCHRGGMLAGDSKLVSEDGYDKWRLLCSISVDGLEKNVGFPFFSKKKKEMANVSCNLIFNCETQFLISILNSRRRGSSMLEVSQSVGRTSKAAFVNGSWRLVMCGVSQYNTPFWPEGCNDVILSPEYDSYTVNKPVSNIHFYVSGVLNHINSDTFLPEFNENASAQNFLFISMSPLIVINRTFCQ